MRTCVSCGAVIHPERLEMLPNTQTCAPCSTEPKLVGFLDYGHKTAPSIVMVNPSDQESLRKAKRAYKRAR